MNAIPNQGLTIDSESEHWIAGEDLPIDARASWTDGDAIVRELNSKGEYEVNDLDSGGEEDNSPGVPVRSSSVIPAQIQAC